MTAVRHRKGTKASEVPDERHEKHWKLDGKVLPGGKVWKKLSIITGGFVGISLGILTSVYVATLHENDLWFSNIKEVEREISFRTECGLYYSYYKQMLQAPSIQSGLNSLMYDNKTESMRTINILERMNVYQEVLLSILYRTLHIKKFLEPIYFYIYTLFGLQAVYVVALYVTSWLLSGTWLSGVLAAFWYITNRPHLPPTHQRLTYLTVFISTFLFSLTWQFNQFMLLIQALVLFTLDSLDFLPRGKVTWIYIIQVVSLLLVCLLQFFNTMIAGSLLLSFNMSILLARKLQNNLKTGGFFSRLGKLFLHVLLVLCLTFLVNNFMKKVLNLESDEHIFKFLKAKFGFGATRDFDANLYLCEEAFGLLPFDTFTRLSDSLVFYAYVFVLFVMAIAAAIAAFQNLCGSANNKSMDKLHQCTVLLKPGAAYNLVHSIMFGCLALSTMRMKYIWISHLCVFAASGMCSSDMWGLILKCVRLHTPQRVSVMRYLTPVLMLLYLFYKFWPRMMAELSELREFYDPDTVELMNWIK
uniref:Uncharacterized protein n=1 Tax=Sphaerodactylus townsendi TaxID=933632 RepID=A0ACB8EA32_9SAUR